MNKVYLYSSPCNLPASFAIHPWFVVVENGVTSRYEVRFIKNKDNMSAPFIHINFLEPFIGLGIFPPVIPGPHWKAKLVGEVSGEEANAIIKILKESRHNYPYTQKSSLLGPNSNTFAQWVLNQSPKFSAKLPWNAFGKGYKR